MLKCRSVLLLRPAGRVAAAWWVVLDSGRGKRPVLARSPPLCVLVQSMGYRTLSCTVCRRDILGASFMTLTWQHLTSDSRSRGPNGPEKRRRRSHSERRNQDGESYEGGAMLGLLLWWCNASCRVGSVDAYQIFLMKNCSNSELFYVADSRLNSVESYLFLLVEIDNNLGFG